MLIAVLALRRINISIGTMIIMIKKLATRFLEYTKKYIVKPVINKYMPILRQMTFIILERFTIN